VRKRNFLWLIVCIAILAIPVLVIEGWNTRAKKEYEPLSLVPKETDFVMVVDMKKIVATKYYTEFKQDKKELDDYYEFTEKTGIDPEKDLDIITISLKKMEDDPDFVLIATGRFDKEKILSSIKKEAAATEEEYQGKTIYKFADRHEKCEEEEMEKEEEARHRHKEDEVRLAFLDSDIVAISNSGLIKNAVDLYQGKGESIEQNQTLMDVVKEIDQDDMVWGAGVVPEKVKMRAPQEHPMGNIVATIKSVVFSLDLEKELDALFKIKSDCKENVKNIADAINGLLALGRMNYAEQPDYMELLEGITVEGTEDIVSVSVHIPENLLDKLSKEVTKKKCKHED
jgi:hypothetical protein